MRITVDTNVMLRLVLSDDEAQERIATATLRDAELVVIGIQSLCELAWVLRRTYKAARADIAGVIAHEGDWLGGETFASFDRKAVALLVRTGRRTLLLGV